MTTFLALIVGAFLSWIISYQIYHKSKSYSDEAFSHILINREIDDVWTVITDPSNFQSFRHLKGHEFTTNEVRKGTPIVVESKLYGDTRKEFVVEWNPPYEFKFGFEPENWVVSILLSREALNTNLVISRKFRSPYWFEVIFDKHKMDQFGELKKMSRDIKNLCEYTIKKKTT